MKSGPRFTDIIWFTSRLGSLDSLSIVGLIKYYPILALFLWDHRRLKSLKIVSEYDQEIPQSLTADNPVAPRERAV